MKDITIIIPVHKYASEEKTMLSNAVSSVPDGLKTIISCASGIADDIKADYAKNKNITILPKADDNNSFCSLVNAAVEKAGDFFSVLELDDEFTPIWQTNMEKYMDAMPTVSVYLPLVDLVDYEHKRYLSNGNEAPWASAFSDKIGFVDNEALLNYYGFYPCGSVISTADFKAVGKLKESIKITFWYEFLLRLTQKGKEVYVVPRICYNHYLCRPDSLSDIYQKEIDKDEQKFWLETAQKEYFFDTDRCKTYEKE